MRVVVPSGEPTSPPQKSQVTETPVDRARDRNRWSHHYPLGVLRRRLTLLIPAIAAGLVLVGCGAEDATEAQQPPPTIPPDAVDLTGQAAVDVGVGDNDFDPPVIIVSPGTDVVWTNVGRNRHNVISSDEEPAFAQIDTEQLDDGSSASRTFDEVGAYPYYCSIHGSPTRGQRGSVLVLPTP